MNGYTGWFSKVFTGDNLSAANYDLGALFTGVATSSTYVYAYDSTGLNRDLCRFVWDVEVMENTGAATIVPAWYVVGANVIIGTTFYGNGLSAALPFASTRQYVERYDTVGTPETYDGGTSTGLGARLAVTSAGDFSYRLKVRPYHFTGWENANLTGATALTTIEPGIVNSAMGRQAAASSYSAEIKMAKDEIQRRLTAAGIDPDKIPTDGVATITTLPTGGTNHQQIATYLIPELCDSATYLALSIIHERYTTRGDDWDSYKSEKYRERYENAYQMALKTLPLNLDGDNDLEAGEQNYGSPKTLSL